MSVAGLVLMLALTAAAVWTYVHPSIERIDGVRYGVRDGRDLTMDILRPGRPNGVGIALMVSGGWKSQRAGEPPAWLVSPLLRAGYTVFAVCHISQPQATIMDIIQDMHRGIRFIRYHAADYGIDPKRIGVTGGSAGGHLSLMLGTRGVPAIRIRRTRWTASRAQCRRWRSSTRLPIC